jgi:hypothetical protein
MDKKLILETAISGGEYRKFALADMINCSLSEINIFLLQNPDIEDRRDAIRPKNAENRRKQYLTEDTAEKIKMLETAIAAGEYRKFKLAALLNISEPTLSIFLLEHPYIEDARNAIRPKIAEKGRKEYLTAYNKTYKRKSRKEYFSAYRQKNPKNTEGVPA